MLRVLKIPTVLIVWPAIWYITLRWTVYRYWGLDIIKYSSWLEVMETWDSGRILPWSFIFVVTFSIPLLFIGFVILFKNDVTAVLRKAIKAPFNAMRRKSIQKLSNKPVKIKKKKSYMEIRPPALKPISGEAFINPRKNLEGIEHSHADREYKEMEAKYGTPKDDFKTPDLSKIKSLNRLKEDDFELEFLDKENIDTDSGKITDTDTQGIDEIAQNAGYKTITDVRVSDSLIDVVAVSDKALILCFEDSQGGDWVADEERFNDDAPLWYSETSPKTSPAYKAIQVRNSVYEAVHKELPEIIIVPVLVISKGNIINASDMLDIWEEQQVFVGRIGQGGPSDIKKLSNLIPPNQDESVSDEVVATVEKILKSLK